MKHYAPGSFNMIDKDGKEYLLTVEQDDYTESPRDAVDLVRIAVQLKNIQQQRRVCKIECDKLRSIYDSFQGKNVTKLLNQDLTKFEKKTYTDKTTVINDMALSHKNNKTK